jgi:uncharacterized membrane protein YphA (DoxX/SURF4 family)
MKRAIQILRYLFALFFIISGLGYFMDFMPLPKMTGMAQQLVGAMVGSGYLMILVKLTEIAGGLLLLCNLLAPLALAVLAPVMLNILLFNLFLNPSTVPFSAVLLVIYLGLVWNYRARLMLVFNKEG